MLMPIRDLNPPRGMGYPYVTVGLIVVNVLVFLWEVSLPAREQEAVILGLGAIPSVVLGVRTLSPALELVNPWLTLITSTFLHGGWMHLFGNMLFLWVFGDNIEAACGRLRYLVFYLVCGIGAALIYIVSDPTSTVPVVGASGAISGVLGAYLILHPRAKVVLLVFFVFFAQLPAVVVLSFWIAFQIFNALMSGGAEGGVAWWAHIGGFFIGAALIVAFRRKGVPLFDRSTEIVPRHALLRRAAASSPTAAGARIVRRACLFRHTGTGRASGIISAMGSILKHALRASAVLGFGVAFALVTACSRMDVTDFANDRPSFHPENYFRGRAEGWGVMQDRFGNLLRQFRIEATGEWNASDRSLSLVETYKFEDGQVDRLKWTLRPVGADRYTATEQRVEGLAEGVRSGNAFHWTYVRRVPQRDGSERTLSFDDWFWLQDDDVLIARASVQRWGFELATISIFYRRLTE